MTRPRGPARLTLLGVGLFWVGVFVAGSLVEGYEHRDDYISSLAGRGSPVAALGVAALLGSALAHAAASWAVRGARDSRLVAALLLASGVAIVVIAVFPQSCRSGPAGCGTVDDSPGDWIGTVHVAGVVAYELVAIAALVTVAVAALGRRATFPRWLGPTSLVLAGVSVVLLSRVGGDDTGLWQRLWVVTHHAWLLILAWLPVLRPSATVERPVDRHRRVSGR